MVQYILSFLFAEQEAGKIINSIKDSLTDTIKDYAILSDFPFRLDN